MNNLQSNKTWLKRSMLFSAGHFFSDIYPGFLAPILPLLMSRYDFSLTFAGFLAAATAFSASMTQTIFGYISDRWSHRFFVIIGPVIAAVFFSILGYMPNKWMILFCLFMGGIGVAQFHPLAAKMVNKVEPEHKGKAMAIFVSGGSIGYSLGPIIVTSLIAYRDIYFVPVAAIPALIFALLMNRFAPKNTINASQSSFKLNRDNIKQITSVSIYVVIGIVRSVVIMGFNAFIPILFSMRGFSLETGGFAIFLIHFFGGLGVLAGGMLSDRISPKIVISASFVAVSPALYLFLHSSGPMAFAALGIAGFFLYSSIPAVITQAQAAMPQNMSVVSSMVMGVSWGIGGMLVMFVGKSADVFGILPTLNVLSFFPVIAFMISLLLFHKKFGETRVPEYV